VTRLLVSVRNAEEARTALDAGVDLIDVKEPSRGSLGAAAPCVVADVVAAVAGRLPVSAALGELLAADDGDAIQRAAAIPPGVRFAKLGLAGCGELPDWRDRWSAALRALPPGIAAVAVAYADWRAASAPPPREVVAAAVQLGCRAMLIDTFDKCGGDLFGNLAVHEVRDVVEQARADGLLAVLAGSLVGHALRQAIELRPDYVAVRGAACRGRRDARLDGALTAALVANLSKAVV